MPISLPVAFRECLICKQYCTERQDAHARSIKDITSGWKFLYSESARSSCHSDPVRAPTYTGSFPLPYPATSYSDSIRLSSSMASVYSPWKINASARIRRAVGVRLSSVGNICRSFGAALCVREWNVKIVGVFQCQSTPIVFGLQIPTRSGQGNRQRLLQMPSWLRRWGVFRQLFIRHRPMRVCDSAANARACSLPSYNFTANA